MRILVNRSRNCQSGLTLLEVAFAILILGTSFVVLLGLQSASVSSSLRIKNSQQAMLIARRILSAVEAMDTSPGISEQSGSAFEILRSLEELAEDRVRIEALSAEEILKSFNVFFSVTDLALPLMEGNTLKKIYLKVSWGDSRPESIELVYLIPEETSDDDYTLEGAGE